MNFTSQYLFRLKRRILDNSGNPIDTISYSDEKCPFFYVVPALDYNIMETKKQMKAPVLRESKDIAELKNWGLAICSIPVGNRKKYYTRQKDFYFVIKSGQMPVGGVTINKLEGATVKGRHYLLYDDANEIVKLIGPNAGILGEGPWIQLEKL